MNDFLNSLLQGDFGGNNLGVEVGLLTLVLAFCIGQVIAWIYTWTHTGLSYSQMFVASLVVMPPLVALVMTLMSGDIVIAFGLLAVFAVVRFRNVLKDTRDTTFVLWAIIEGMSAGTQRFSTALLGCVFVSMIFIYLRVTSFGGRHRYDFVLTLQVAGRDAMNALRNILWRHSSRVQLASQRDSAGDHWDMSYRLLLRDPNRSNDLLKELEATQGMGRVSLYHRADEAEA